MCGNEWRAPSTRCLTESPGPPSEEAPEAIALSQQALTLGGDSLLGCLLRSRRLESCSDHLLVIDATGGVVSRSYVTNLRKGQIENPGYDKLRAIAKAMGFPPELWFEDAVENLEDVPGVRANEHAPGRSTRRASAHCVGVAPSLLPFAPGSGKQVVLALCSSHRGSSLCG